MAVLGLVLVFVLLCCPLLSGSKKAESLSKFGEILLYQGFFKGITDIRKILLNHTSGIFYLGSKDVILAMDINDLNKEPQKIVWDVPLNEQESCLKKGKTQAECRNFILVLEFLGEERVYVCGTYAFDPKCAILEQSSFILEKSPDGEVTMETGRGKCSFDPETSFTAVMADGILYTGSTIDFMGSTIKISRATGPVEKRIKTKTSSSWLNEPKFVSSTFVAQSPDNNPTGEDDHIFFFFTENAVEFDLETRVSRVARVCKSDVGGNFALSGTWTTFVKAHIVCEDKASHLHYDIITDVFTQQHTPGDPSSTHFYTLFISQWRAEAGTAVCVFSLSDINKVLGGPSKERHQGCPGFTPPSVTTPKPGQCLNNELKEAGFKSSMDITIPTLNYVENRVLTENKISTKIFMVRKNVIYTKLAVTPVKSRGGQIAALLHLGTDHGELHRVALVGQKSSLLQEVPLFSPTEPVKDILLYKGWALVVSPLSLARVQADGCTFFTSCEVCARARELDCVWSETTKTCIITDEDPGEGDVVDAALKKCGGQEGRCNPSITELIVLTGIHVLLPCVQLSARPCSWEHPSEGHTKQHHSDLEVIVSKHSLGKYVCTCLEDGSEKEKPTLCQRAAYHLKMGERQNIVAAYVFSFWGILLLGSCLLFYITHRLSVAYQVHFMAERSLTSATHIPFTSNGENQEDKGSLEQSRPEREVDEAIKEELKEEDKKDEELIGGSHEDGKEQGEKPTSSHKFKYTKSLNRFVQDPSKTNEIHPLTHSVQ